MHIYHFGVGGASPGIGGVVVVVDSNMRDARKKAKAEVERMNEIRSRRTGYSPVELDPAGQRMGPAELPGVVYSYDGEA